MYGEKGCVQKRFGCDKKGRWRERRVRMIGHIVSYGRTQGYHAQSISPGAHLMYDFMLSLSAYLKWMVFVCLFVLEFA